MISDIQKQGPLIECVLNFSEGRDINLLDQISASVNKLKGVEVIHRDIGYDANRTVFTIAGTPDDVIIAVTKIFEIAAKKIDMKVHEGVHPCTGALDVIPIVPIQKISNADCVTLLKTAARHWSLDFNIPICYYGMLSREQHQSTLAQIRKGGYSKLPERIKEKSLLVNVGPSSRHEQLGLSSCTVREFMIAFNVNMNTEDISIAKKIAKALRTLRSSNSKIKDVRFLAWHMEEYGCTQISTNIYDIASITMQELYYLIDQVARSMGARCEGSELIGLTPLSGLTRDTNHHKEVAVEIGLSSVVDFVAEERILEKVLGLPLFR